MPTLFLVTATCLALGVDTAAEAVNKDLAKLQGEWTMVSGEIDTQAMPEAFLKSSRRIAKGNELTVIIGGKVFLKAKITIDPTKKPKTIDYAMTEGLTTGKTQLGIYELAEDTVKFCFASPGKERPTDFTTKVGSGRTLSVWKRAKTEQFKFPEGKHGKGELRYVNGIPVLMVTGTPEEMGEQMGTLGVKPATGAVEVFKNVLASRPPWRYRRVPGIVPGAPACSPVHGRRAAAHIATRSLFL